MPTKEKKVIIFIVEGPSDQAALGELLKNYFESSELKFFVVHGDITSSDFITKENLIDEINQCIDTIKRKYYYKDEHIIQVIHIADTDGAFISSENIVQKATPGTLYYCDHIETGNKEALIKRNTKKAELLHKLSTTGKVMKGSIRYRIYYMSCNLEHVLYNELREFSDDEKTYFSDEFAERYESKIDEFIGFISNPEFAVEGTYKDTWKFIRKELNSLNRFTNISQLFKHK